MKIFGREQKLSFVSPPVTACFVTPPPPPRFSNSRPRPRDSTGIRPLEATVIAFSLFHMCLPHSLTLTLFHMWCHINSLSLSHSVFQSISLSHVFAPFSSSCTLSLSLSHSHTHTRTQSFSLSLAPLMLMKYPEIRKEERNKFWR